MISEDSESYCAHPGLGLHHPLKGLVRSRNQLVLDFPEEARDFIYGRLCELLDSAIWTMLGGI